MIAAYLAIGLISATATGWLLHRWMHRIIEQAETRAQERSYEERRRFIRRLDHEFKNPLTAMRVALANLAETDDPEERRKIRSSIHEQILRLSSLVGNLRKLANLDNEGNEQLPVDTHHLVAQLIHFAADHPDASQRQITLPDMETLPPLPIIIGDNDLLELALYNLLDNAIKFTEPNKHIEVRVYADNTRFTLEVEDYGYGIPEEDLPFIWEELYRSKDVHGIPGSGLGLALVKNITELHSGAVSITSTYGQGTTAVLSLPVDHYPDPNDH